MKEPICNLFLFVNDDVIREIGVVWHNRDGNDAQKIKFLQEQVKADSEKATRHFLPSTCKMVLADKTVHGAISYPSFVMLQRQGTVMVLLEQTIFTHYKFTPKDPLMVMTCVVNGEIKIDVQTDLKGNF